MVEFQSLIGRLQTDTRGRIAQGVFVFQSLIGRLQTALPDAVPPHQQGFQSLIGRLQTMKSRNAKKTIVMSFNPS